MAISDGGQFRLTTVVISSTPSLPLLIVLLPNAVPRRGPKGVPHEVGRSGPDRRGGEDGEGERRSRWPAVVVRARAAFEQRAYMRRCACSTIRG